MKLECKNLNDIQQFLYVTLVICCKECGNIILFNTVLLEKIIARNKNKKVERIK